MPSQQVSVFQHTFFACSLAPVPAGRLGEGLFRHHLNPSTPEPLLSLDVRAEAVVAGRALCECSPVLALRAQTRVRNPAGGRGWEEAARDKGMGIHTPSAAQHWLSMASH